MSAAMRFFEMRRAPHDTFFSHIPTRELVRLMQTCCRIYGLVKDRCFNVDHLLIPFFGDAAKANQFRELQRQTQTVISGSTALQFFNRLTWPDSDLDLYVPHASAAFIVLFLRDSGYAFRPREIQRKDPSLQLFDDGPKDYHERGIIDVLDFHNESKKIQVIIFGTPSSMEVIAGFHSTCVMNVITHDVAFALYPWSTFVTKEAVKVKSVSWSTEEGKEAARRKYEERGWKMLKHPSPNCTSELGVRMHRSVGDRFTWTISLPCLPPSFGRARSDFIREFQWRLDRDGEETSMMKHIVSLGTYTTP
ncbi:NADPH-dependent methylglyoxal reductase GRE2 [Mycena sanguinolenta]|uniref:NADPH-dependent methylglyoxal reductase GRE2 n=1 Tax=Mycena sanguinolenta TaxID=230812 RepID=A0A8H6XGM3_9AGAR|nr:NADPH-dependent methylglyoxal reductase GRE2 [Mycena sanguinolenta]